MDEDLGPPPYPALPRMDRTRFGHKYVTKIGMLVGSCVV